MLPTNAPETRTTRWSQACWAALAALLFSMPAVADSTAKDLRSVIVLQGNSCASVTGYDKNATNDYTVTCAGGESYRVRVGADSRVVVERR
ncbi:MAG: hypothetical protein HOI95_00560 [Chromatiales bacterium]|jgi:hypothetical protein|nr:hypothetical protein [Chromatiales bacterium]